MVGVGLPPYCPQDTGCAVPFSRDCAPFFIPSQDELSECDKPCWNHNKRFMSYFNFLLRSPHGHSCASYKHCLPSLRCLWSYHLSSVESRLFPWEHHITSLSKWRCCVYDSQWDYWTRGWYGNSHSKGNPHSLVYASSSQLSFEKGHIFRMGNVI